MVRVGGLVKIYIMTCNALNGRSRESIGMALQTLRRDMFSRQRKARVVVVKGILFFPGRVAGQACGIAVFIPGDSSVRIIGLRVSVTGNTRKNGVVVEVGMAIRTVVPRPLVCPAVNREG